MKRYELLNPVEIGDYFIYGWEESPAGLDLLVAHKRIPEYDCRGTDENLDSLMKFQQLTRILFDREEFENPILTGEFDEIIEATRRQVDGYRDSMRRQAQEG